MRQREWVERKKAEAEAQRLRAEKEREDMGVMWGIGMCYIYVATSNTYSKTMSN